ncbi:MAG: ATP-dependent helicase HrpA [Actinomycetota bacterium]|jgi:ATP-dependent helicase HrpA|nr:ATP-dependent helicase HrpA [Actinomycetota bacterium]
MRAPSSPSPPAGRGTSPEPRRRALPPIRYPAQLPVSQRREEIAAAIRDHQVVILAGETGSGKTTQLPKICLELGRGESAMIGHTQPRRIAARAVAERIAEELGTPLGTDVGYTVRFNDRSSPDTRIKLMTDGILLAEIQRDRTLSAYDTLIVDEAHERSLNVDFLLGYLKALLPRRPDLKVVITSATIDTARFARHFYDAPVVEVSGRTFPVEVRYRPVVDPDSEDGEERDQVQAIVDAVDELSLEGPGDVLVFLSGEREIRDTADALRRHVGGDAEILPLYARLSAAEQHRVFAPHAGRRVVLATNVAETSLTVPGIRYVVDPGTARISRYSHQRKVQRLPIEKVSQASANQRKGRCGRVEEGICIRLYSEQDFLSRPQFTEPEILRTNLASVILAMTALGLGDIAAFPFVEPPDRRQVRDGIALLEELGALEPGSGDERRRLTPLGRRLARLPLDPRLARMVLEADRNGCVEEVMVIATALSVQDPRERPADKQQAADDKHRRFADDRSDFLTYWNLWTYLQQQQDELSSSAFRRLCKAEFLHYLRVREWQDLYGQLRSVARSLGITSPSRHVPEARDPDALLRPLHTALLAGLLSHVGLWEQDKREYVGARGARFAPWPGSALVRKPPRWVMAGELVETSRLWGRDLARIEPEWVEPLAEHLVRRSYSEPHWSREQGAVMAYEKVTLYGVPIVASRRITYGRIDPGLSRELFIRHALVQGEWRTHHRFFHANRELLEEVEELEHRARRRDILVDDETLFDFYDRRVPADVVSARHFDAWWKKTRRTQPDLLAFEPAMLMRDDARQVSGHDYPDAWRTGGQVLPLTYQFEPGADADGVTVHVPLPVLNQVEARGFDWQVPGLRLELVTALLRSLPKPLRRSLVPAPDHARALVDQLTPDGGALTDAVARGLRARTGVDVPPDAWDLSRVPDHLRLTFRVEDERGRRLAEGKDLTALKRALQPTVARTVSQAAADVEVAALRDWSFGELPASFTGTRDGHEVRGFPALVDEGETVAVRVLGSSAQASRATWAGTRRLLLLQVTSPLVGVVGRLDNATKLALGHNRHGSVPALLDDCLTCAVDALMSEQGGIVRDADGFARLRDAVAAELPGTLLDVVRQVAAILTTAREVELRAGSTASAVLLPALVDVRAQVASLVRPGFVAATGRGRLRDVHRYLRAAERRLESLDSRPDRDRVLLAQVQAMDAEYAAWRAALPESVRDDPSVHELRWMMQELRVSLFAQTLGTPSPVSPQRIRRAMEQTAARLRG